jgi:hypothetical protein
MAATGGDLVLTGAVTARVVGRRRVSKRLAFYDLREIADAEPADVLSRCRDAAAAGATATAARPHRRDASAELCCKAGAGPLFVDAASLAATQKDALKLGNVVRVRGRWLAGKRGEPCVEDVESIEIVERWAETNPGKVFQRDDANKSRAEDRRDELAEESAPSTSRGTTPTADAGDGDGDGAKGTKPCKYWLNQGRCHKGDLCAYAHASRETQAAWISERKRRRRALATADGDPHAEGGGAKTKAARARVFVDWLVETFGVEALSRGSGVLDVAGGRGDVSFELHTKRGVPCTLVEPRERKLNRMQHKWLKARVRKEAKNGREEAKNGREEDGNGREEAGNGSDATTPPSRRTDAPIADDAGVLCAQVREMFTPENWYKFEECAVVVGMHPDEATESIVDFAVARGKPFAVVPCCVFPAMFPDRRVRRDGEGEDGGGGKVGGGVVPVTERRQLVRWLAGKTRGEVAYLAFEGANQVVYSKTPPPPPAADDD